MDIEFIVFEMMSFFEFLCLSIMLYVLLRPIKSEFIFKYRNKILLFSWIGSILFGMLSFLVRGENLLDIFNVLNKSKDESLLTDGLTSVLFIIYISLSIILILTIIFSNLSSKKDKKKITNKNEILKINVADIVKIITDSNYIGPDSLSVQNIAFWQSKDGLKYLIFNGLIVPDGNMICECRKDEKNDNVYYVFKCLSLEKSTGIVRFVEILDWFLRLLFLVVILLCNYYEYVLKLYDMSQNKMIEYVIFIPVTLMFSFCTVSFRKASDFYSKFMKYFFSIMYILCLMFIIFNYLLYLL